MGGIAPARVPQVATLVEPDFKENVSSLSDLPAPVSGAITLAANTAYTFGPGVDLGGAYLVPGANCAIFGVYTEASSLTSAGLDANTALIQGGEQFLMRDITIANVGTALGLDTTDPGTSKTLEWSNVNFSGVATIGTISNYANVLVDILGILNASSELTFSGTIGTIGLSQLFINMVGSTGTGILLDSLTVTRRIRITDSAMVVPSGATGIEKATATIPDEALILANVNASGSGTYLDGTSGDAAEALFSGCVGIENSRFDSYLTMNANATVTTIAAVDTPVKIAGTTVSRLAGRFTNTANRATCNAATPRLYKIDIRATITGSDIYTIYVAINGSIIAYTGNSINLSNANNNGVIPVQHVAELAADDYVEAWIENNNDASNVTVPSLSISILP